MIALVGGRLIDGTGRDPVEETTVIIEKQKVTQAGPKAQIELPPDCQVIDVAGMTVMPGMMDLHVHLCLGENEMVQWSWGVYPPQFENHLATIGLRAFDRARKTLAMGFTTVRDMGDVGWVVVAVRDAINAGLVEGPRIIASGPYLNTTA